MTGFDYVATALIAISIIVSLVLLIAWADFDRPRHVLSWAIGCGLIALGWTLVLFTWNPAHAATWLTFLALTFMAIGAGINAFGFGQRSGGALWRPTACAVLIDVLVTAGLVWGGHSMDAAVLPLYLLVGVTSWIASRALVGRRKGERAAERYTLLWLRGTACCGFVLLVISTLSLRAVWAGIPSFSWFALAPLLPATMTCVGVFAMFLITADLADQSRRLAGTDMLTGLLNRRGFQDAATALIASAKRDSRDVCLAAIDIDRFKDVNDSFGHLSGDEVLRRFAACLTAETAPRDVIARVGGEEFALILADRNCDAAQALLETLRCSIADCPLGLPGDHRITASFGLAELTPASDLAALLAEADRALYRAKNSGRNRIVVAS